VLNGHYRKATTMKLRPPLASRLSLLAVFARSPLTSTSRLSGAESDSFYNPERRPNKMATALFNSGKMGAPRLAWRLVRASLIVSTVALVALVGSQTRSRAATTRFVAVGGNDNTFSNDCTNSLSPCATIDNAILHATSGDVIMLGPGTLIQPPTVVLQNVTILGDPAGTTVTTPQVLPVGLPIFSVGTAF